MKSGKSHTVLHHRAILHGTLVRDGNANSNRSGGETFLGQFVPDNFGGNFMASEDLQCKATWTGLFIKVLDS